jgi:hypothetical protein
LFIGGSEGIFLQSFQGSKVSVPFPDVDSIFVDENHIFIT